MAALNGGSAIEPSAEPSTAGGGEISESPLKRASSVKRTRLAPAAPCGTGMRCEISRKLQKTKAAGPPGSARSITSHRAASLKSARVKSLRQLERDEVLLRIEISARVNSSISR